MSQPTRSNASLSNKPSTRPASKSTSKVSTNSKLGKSFSVGPVVSTGKETGNLGKQNSAPKQASRKTKYKTGQSNASKKSSTSSSVLIRVAPPKSEAPKAAEKNSESAIPFYSRHAPAAPNNIVSIQPGLKYLKEGNTRRQEVLKQLRDKLKRTKSGVDRSTKAGKGAVPVDGSIPTTGGSVKGGFNAMSMSQIESHIQTFTLRFIDLIICCMVVDNYIYGMLVLMASLAEIIIGWMYLVECTVQPLLPYLLIANGVLNIIEAHMRNLANQRHIDYFVMSVFRLMAFFSFVTLIITLLTIDSSMTIWFLPPDSIYVSNGGIVYCSVVLYYFSYYLCVVGGVMILVLAVYGLGCIGYMVYSTGGRRIQDSRLSSSGGSSKGGSSTSAAKSAATKVNK